MQKQYKLLRRLLIVTFILFMFPLVLFAEEKKETKIKLVNEIPVLSDGSVLYSQFKGVFEPLGKYIDIEVLDIDLNNKNLIIKPAVSENLDAVKNIAEKNNAIAAINTGFFDYINGMSVSYITINGKEVANPKNNDNLTGNTNIKPYLDKIYNRAELKVLDCSNKKVFKIDFHNSKNKNCELLDLIQGGPMLLPVLNLAKEAFLDYKDGKKVREAANVTNNDARVAVGLTPDNHMIWVIANAGIRDSAYYGLTITELATLMKFLDTDSAIAYDGGRSTTLYLRLPDGTSKTIIGDIDPKGERVPARVKSVLILTKEK
ncbi:MAG: phosphodiester glycosidase family protein [Cyanobacteriota bacterium]